MKRIHAFGLIIVNFGLCAAVGILSLELSDLKKVNAQVNSQLEEQNLLARFSD